MTKFFDYVWRFNALAIAAAAILMLIITASFLSQFIRGKQSSEAERGQEWVERKPDQKAIFSLGAGASEQVQTLFGYRSTKPLSQKPYPSRATVKSLR